MDELTERIKLHEGLSQSAYVDSLGYLTIGYGALIDKRLNGQLSIAACEFILNEQIAQARSELKDLSFYKYLDPVRQDVLVEMCFNIGLTRLYGFRNMLDALGTKDYIRASQELGASLWAVQVGAARANDLIHRLRYGRYS